VGLQGAAGRELSLSQQGQVKKSLRRMSLRGARAIGLRIVIRRRPRNDLLVRETVNTGGGGLRRAQEEISKTAAFFSPLEPYRKEETILIVYGMKKISGLKQAVPGG